MIEQTPVAWTDGEGQHFKIEIWPISLRELIEQLQDKDRHLHIAKATGARCRTRLHLADGPKEVFVVMITLPNEQTILWDSALGQWDIPGQRCDGELFCEEIK